MTEKLEIRNIPTKEGVLKNYEYLQKVPTHGISHVDILQGCLEGKLIMLDFYKNDEFVGIAVVQHKPPETLLIIALYLPNLIKEFDSTLLQWCRDHKITQYLAISKENPEAYSRLMKMQIDSTTFVREVE